MDGWKDGAPTPTPTPPPSPRKVNVVRHGDGEQLMKIFCSDDDEGTNSPFEEELGSVSVANWPPAPARTRSRDVVL